jgi:hypothetical protein
MDERLIYPDKYTKKGTLELVLRCINNNIIKQASESRAIYTGYTGINHFQTFIGYLNKTKKNG